MKKTQPGMRWWLVIQLMLFPLGAHANAIIPYMIVPWGQVFLLPLVIIIEGVILQRLLGGKLRSILFQSFAANLLSTALGAALYFATMPLVGNRLFDWWSSGGFSAKPYSTTVSRMQGAPSTAGTPRQ
ncbi:MAG: hypothetical protein AAB268_11635, partial [Elusimicrobiota bacterium]